MESTFYVLGKLWMLSFLFKEFFPYDYFLELQSLTIIKGSKKKKMPGEKPI